VAVTGPTRVRLTVKRGLSLDTELCTTPCQKPSGASQRIDEG